MTKKNIGPFAIIGLGKMGSNLARQALERGLSVFGLTRGKVPPDLAQEGLKPVPQIRDLRSALTPPRVIFLYVPAGPTVDDLLAQLESVLDPGDVVLDGGNSYWRDSMRRWKQAKERNINFLDLGTSGGILGARHGACFMVGGEPEPVAMVEPILRKLAVAEGYVHAGPPGAGHFVKLVHNGIEFGMLEAIAEGVDMLERYPERLPIADVLRSWRHGSVIRSWLVDLMEDAYRRQRGLADVPPYVEDTGEVNWLVGDALTLEVAIPVIAQSVMRLFASRDDIENWSRAIAMMRQGFGGHPFGASAAIARERHEGRVGDTAPPKRS
jgi:6-phosphogluconate dehydrogenase